MDGSIPASHSAEFAAVVERPARPFSPWLEAWRRFRRHRMAVLSAGVLIVMVAAIVFAPFFYGVAVNDIDFSARLKPPSLAHPFGTDDLGQDLLARILYGGAPSLSPGPSPPSGVRERGAAVSARR